MLTHHRTGHIFMSAILKDRLHSAVARFSVPSSIEFWAQARRWMCPRCVVFSLRQRKVREFELSRSSNLDL